MCTAAALAADQQKPQFCCSHYLQWCCFCHHNSHLQMYRLNCLHGTCRWWHTSRAWCFLCVAHGRSFVLLNRRIRHMKQTKWFVTPISLPSSSALQLKNRNWTNRSATEPYATSRPDHGAEQYHSGPVSHPTAHGADLLRSSRHAMCLQ